MIIVEVGRGLGNSMYVYAAGKALAEHHGTELKIDSSYLDAWPRSNRKFGGSWNVVIEKFNISAKRATKKEVGKFLLRTGFRPLDRLIYKLKLFERNIVRYPTSGSIKEFYNVPNDTYLLGYFGDEKFFKKIKRIIRKDFTLKDKYKDNILSLIKDISYRNAVSIHIRRGDLLKLKNHYVLGLNYYKRAIEIIKKKVKNPVFYVFSDEIDWCKNNFVNMGAKLHFIEDNAGYEDFELMRNCKYNILANSSLSWWTGYLNNHSDKIIIAPKKFTMFKYVKGGILPNSWIRT